jgi:hypothetical protein
MRRSALPRKSSFTSTGRSCMKKVKTKMDREDIAIITVP